jgi:hypothetical protein
MGSIPKTMFFEMVRGRIDKIGFDQDGICNLGSEK